MFLKLVFLSALLKFGQSQNQCVREIRSLKDDLQVELRDVMRRTITDSSVSREDVEELVEDKATKEDIQTLNHTMAADNQLIKDTLTANKNATIEELDQLISDKAATKEDVQSLKSESQLMMDTLVANQNVTRNELAGLLNGKVTDICQAVSSLNFSIATGNEHIMETLLKIIESQDSMNNTIVATQSDARLVPADQCLTRDEIKSFIREEVESVVRSEVESIVQREVQSIAIDIAAELKNKTAELLKAIAPLHKGPYTCNGTPGWRQVVFINMTDTSYNCPPGLSLTSYSKRTCGRVHTNRRDCSSTTFSVGGSEYRQVCGRIRGYQLGTVSAFRGYLSQSYSIEMQYVDGVSLTHGAVGRRQHIWTYAAGITEVDNGHLVLYKCPCDVSRNPPPFVSNDYFCESGLHSQWDCSLHCGVIFPDDPLWDGQGCTSTSTCCQINNPPWFTKSLPNPTTDDIELRLCLASGYLSNGTPYGDIPLELIELYVQ